MDACIPASNPFDYGETLYLEQKKRGPMENPPTDRIRDAGKTTHTEERLDILERMRNKRLKSNKKFCTAKYGDGAFIYIYFIL